MTSSFCHARLLHDLGPVVVNLFLLFLFLGKNLFPPPLLTGSHLFRIGHTIPFIVGSHLFRILFAVFPVACSNFIWICHAVPFMNCMLLFRLAFRTSFGFALRLTDVNMAIKTMPGFLFFFRDHSVAPSIMGEKFLGSGYSVTGTGSSWGK